MLYVNNNNIIDTAFFGETELTKIFFNGTQVWAKAITSAAWNWCDSCNITGTSFRDTMLPVIQAAGGTYISLTTDGQDQGVFDKYLLNTDATEPIQITIEGHAPIIYMPGDTLDFVNAGDPYLIYNGVMVSGGRDKPNVYFAYSNHY